jgi:hypothetical protein
MGSLTVDRLDTSPGPGTKHELPPLAVLPSLNTVLKRFHGSYHDTYCGLEAFRLFAGVQRANVTPHAALHAILELLRTPDNRLRMLRLGHPDRGERLYLGAEGLHQ